MANTTIFRYESPIGTLLATHPTQLHYIKPQNLESLWVLWSQNERSQNNSSSDDPGLIPDPWVIHEKIKSLFSKLEECVFYGLIQFWAPVTVTGGRRLLTTSDQPFALTNHITDHVITYRKCCQKYQYNIDVNKLEVEEDPMILSGAPASAFLNHLPEVVVDLGAHQDCPLASSALDCALTASFVLPICDPSQSCCVGIVECVQMWSGDLVRIFKKLNTALEGVGLNTFDVQECQAYKTIRDMDAFSESLGGNKLAPWKAKCKTTRILLHRKDIEQQFGRTMKEAAKNLNVSLSTLKRKCKVLGISEWQGSVKKLNDSYKNQSETNEEGNGAIQDPSTINGGTFMDENTLTIKAEYADDVIKFHLPISLATFVAVEMEIGKKFKLNPTTYKLKYLDEDGDWILMVSDQDIGDCIKSLRNSNKTAIRFRVYANI